MWAARPAGPAGELRSIELLVARRTRARSLHGLATPQVSFVASRMNQQFSLSLVEKDLHGDYLSVWSYPNVAGAQQLLVEKLVALTSLETTQARFVYTKVKSEWIYVLSVSVKTDAVVKDASLGLITSTFNPEKWHAVLKVLLQQYLDNKGEPVKILEAYLALLTQKRFGSLDLADPRLSDEKSCLAVGNLKELWTDLGFDTIILFNAMLLKKRILIVGDSLPHLLSVMRSMPQFVSHRKDWSVLRPVVLESSALQLEDLQQSGVYVAGTLDARVATHREIKYDVLVSLPEKRVTISTDSMAALKMCSFHKDVANETMLLTDPVSPSFADATNNDVILKLNEWTARVLSQVQSLGRDGIGESVKSASTAQWILRLADAEGL